jgi:hypothetical protein
VNITRTLAALGAFAILLQLADMVYGAHLGANARPLPVCAGVGTALAWVLFGGSE